MADVPEVRRQVIGELVSAGYEFRGGLLVAPSGQDKEAVRRSHEPQRDALLCKSSRFVHKWEDSVLERFADGSEVDPAAIDPVVTTVTNDEDGALFRFAALHWSVPVSQGYGRRTRFLVTDRANDKLIGIMALGDPVFNLGARDRLIGWDADQRQQRLYNVFDAFVLGAVEPYRQLIAGKLIALCAVSDPVVQGLEEKYRGAVTQILQQEKLSQPVLITTTSALGRSSIYNRLTLDSKRVFQSVGFTEGFGHFQFSSDIFEMLTDLVDDEDDARGNRFGDGPNWKIRTIRKALERLGLPGDLLKHGVRREIFLAPLGVGWRAYLRGETTSFQPYGYELGRIADQYRDRWAIPRAKRRPEFAAWKREDMSLASQLEAAERRAGGVQT